MKNIETKQRQQQNRLHNVHLKALEKNYNEQQNLLSKIQNIISTPRSIRQPTPSQTENNGFTLTNGIIGHNGVARSNKRYPKNRANALTKQDRSLLLRIKKATEKYLKKRNITNNQMAAMSKKTSNFGFY